jgi:hypothetical protein
LRWWVGTDIAALLIGGLLLFKALRRWHEMGACLYRDCFEGTGAG